MSGYSRDLRLRVLAAVDRGMPMREVAETFRVSVPTVKRWLKRRREFGEVEPRPAPGRPAVKGALLMEWLPGNLRDNPNLTLEERRQAFEKRVGVRVSTATVSRNIRRLRGG